MTTTDIKKAIYATSAGSTLFATRVFAQVEKAQSELDNVTPSGTQVDLNTWVINIVNALIGIIAIASVIMLIVGGFRYVFSSGNEKNVTGAKDTILYSIIGLVVAILAFAIVNFVLQQLQG